VTCHRRPLSVRHLIPTTSNAWRGDARGGELRPVPDGPVDLGREGRALFRRIETWRKAERLALDPHEVPQVAELCRCVDRMAAIRRALVGLDPREPAWTRLAAEERQQRLAYGRQVSSLGFPSGVVEDGRPARPAKGSTPRSRRAQKAAASRWGIPGA
jgi:hypothetical protein